MSGIRAKVKSVLSGDTLVLKSTTRTGVEKVVSLAFVSAPKLRREGDEPFAFQSREFLRKLIVDKEVEFKHFYTIPSTQREYGVITLSDGSNLAELLTAEGQVRVREETGKPRAEDAEDGEEEILVKKLRIYESQARSASRGLWTRDDDGRIESQYESPADPQAFLEEHKGEITEAIVERVISGDRVAVRLIFGPKTQQQLVLLLAGVRCPSSARQDAQGNKTPGEQYGDEAKEYVELRLLQRSVSVELLGVSPQGQLIGNVVHAQAGNIVEFLLLQGLGRCVDFHSSLLGPYMATLRQAEKNAKDNQLRLWKSHVKKVANSANSFEAQVGRVISADTLILRNKAGTERKINLSSVRQPKPSDPSQAPFQNDAKEFLRKKLIGKTVRVSIDGKRAATDGYEEKEMATVTFNNKNIALLLVESGYASVIRHRREDEDRSPIWDELLAAEETSRAAQKGMYSPKAPATAKMVEASETLQKAKGYLSFLQRQKKVPAIVDYVASGSRFKLIVPKENARLTFILGGIRCPRTARNSSEQSEPWGQEALDYTTKRCMQRDVEIDVEDIDRVGGFIGTLYVNRESIAKGLVEEGLASVHAYSAEKSGHATELFGAENRAKAAHKGMWKDWTPEADLEDLHISTPTNGKAAETFEKKKDYRDIIIVNIEPDVALKVQVVGPGTVQLESLTNAFRKHYDSPLNNTSAVYNNTPPRNGEYVAVKFSEDGLYYRGRVRGVDRAEKTAEILFIDFGNAERHPFSDLRPLVDQFSVSKLKGQALDAVLSFLQFPAQPEYASDAMRAIHSFTAGKQLVANVNYTAPDGVLYVTVFDPSKSETSDASLNADLVAEGYARVKPQLKPWEKPYTEVVSMLRELQDKAYSEHLGMWEYGDPFDE